jgi:TonB family protein
MRIRRLKLLPFLLLPLGSAPAQADVTARYDVGTPMPLVVQVNDAGHARINMGRQSAILVRDGTAYVLMADLEGPYAIRYEELMAEIGEATRMLYHRQATTPGPAEPEYEAVEVGPATQAGYRGTAWTIVRHGQSPRPAPFELVVSSDPVLAPVGRAIARLATNEHDGFAPVWGTPSFGRGFLTAMHSVFRRGTVLRFGTLMRLQSVSTDPIPASTFALPGEPLTRQQFAARAGFPNIPVAAAPDPNPGVPDVLPPPPPSDGRGGTRARANLASYVSDADYPPEAIIMGQQGTVGFQLEVAPDGSVKRCAVISSSESPALDEATCRIMSERGRFTPARDRHGRPVTDRVSSRIRWVLPDMWPGEAPPAGE